MIPQKLFNNKSLHPDRDKVFEDDLNTFYNLYILKLLNPPNKIMRFLEEDILSTYNIFFSQGQNNQVKDLTRLSNEEIYNLELYASKLNYLKKKKDYKSLYYNPDKTNEAQIEAKELLISLLTSEEIKFDALFKSMWKERKMSLLHLAKSKEENTNEYYQVLFKEVQLYLFPDDNTNIISKIFSVYAMYTFYNTQPYKTKFQITTIPECLQEINILLNEVKLYNAEIFSSLCSIVKQLYSSYAFKIGVVIGLKTIILNKYSLPIELKSDIYSEYKELFRNKERYDNVEKKEVKELAESKDLLYEYKNRKINIVNNIKDLVSDSKSSLLYCTEMNKKKLFKSEKEKKTLMNLGSVVIKEYQPSDLKKDIISKININMNQFDDSNMLFNLKEN